MKKIIWLGAVVPLLGLACAPDISHVAPVKHTTMQFDPAATPPAVPSPTDLAMDFTTGKVNVPVDPNSSPATQEFTRDYLDTLNGFPSSSTAAATVVGGNIDPSTLTATTVLVSDLTNAASKLNPVVAATPQYDATSHTLMVPAPTGGWTPGHQFMIVVVGGPNGVKDTTGQPVYGSAVWALARSADSLVTCTDLTSPDCQSATPLIPTAAQAVQLEQLRRGFAPLLDGLAANGFPRDDIALLWTFSISSNTQVAFDPAATPPVVPVPNDLAVDPATGKLDVPPDPNTSPANQEFTRDYIDNLTGFPVATTASAAVINGDLDPATVTSSTVMVNDLTAIQTSGSGAVSVQLQYDAATHSVIIPAPGGAWTPGDEYEIVIVGGANGVKNSGGAAVHGSPVWALARSSQTLVTCTDLSSSACQSATPYIPSAAQAVQLEQLRLAFKPLLDALATKGLERKDVAALWTFTTDGEPQMEFDPANGVIPFPNDLLLDPTTGNVNLPVPSGASAEQAQLIAGLNTLNGFSTTAPLVSENSDTDAALTGGALIDSNTLDAVGLVPLVGATTTPDVTPCLNCTEGSLALPTNPQQLEIRLNVPLDPQATYAAFVTTDLMSTDGHPVVPSPAFALFRLANPLVDGNGHSTVIGVSDAEAQALEPARQAFKPMFDALDAAGYPRSSLALAWSFTTQTEQSQLDMLHAAPASLPSGSADPVTFGPDTNLTTCPGVSGGCPYPVTDIGSAYSGTIIDPFLLTGPAGTLTPDQNAIPPLIHTIPFILTIPSGAPPSGGWPVVMFGHGLGGNRTEAMAIANALAQGGYAMIAIDDVWHGDRVSCTGLGAFLDNATSSPAGTFTDGFACASGYCDEGFPIGHCVAGPTATDFGNACTFLSNTSANDGTGGDAYCQSIGQGQCRPTAAGTSAASFCDGSDFNRVNGQPAITIPGGPTIYLSGWNIFNLANLFATRDNFRQQVVDDAQVAAVVANSDAACLNVQLDAALHGGTPAGTTYLDGANINYVGQSLGSILGTLYTSTAPEIHDSVLNVPAGSLVQVLLRTTDPSLVALQSGFFASLNSQGIATGSPAFYDFLGTAQWILDPADPVNAAYSLTHGIGAPADRQVFMQYIQGDGVLDNFTTGALIAAALRNNMTCGGGASTPCLDTYEFVDTGVSSYSLPADPVYRHGFLLNDPKPASPTPTADQVLTAVAQSQVVHYLQTGTVQALP